MNERIKEFAEKVYVTGDPWKNKGEPEYLWFNFREDALQKFAELMVQKFDDILVLECLDCVGSQEKQSAQRIERLREKVKTYFGVEE